MKSRGLAVLFAAGCIILLAIFIIGWANSWEITNHVGIVQILTGALAVVALELVVIGILNKDKTRWQALATGAVLILGFSVITFFGIGVFVAPVGLILLGISLWRLLRRKPACGTC